VEDSVLLEYDATSRGNRIAVFPRVEMPWYSTLGQNVGIRLPIDAASSSHKDATLKYTAERSSKFLLCVYINVTVSFVK
jgi:hypothetical protein